MPTFLDESTTNPVPPTVRSEENKLVEEAVVEKRLVEVAEVVVEVVKTALVAVRRERVLSQRRAEVSVKSPPVEM